jgi:hypothetical protein
MRTYLFLAIVFSIAGCGGSVAEPVTDATQPTSSQPPPPSGEPGNPTAPLPDEGPWGTWRITALEGPPGIVDEKNAPPALELEVRPNGTAYRYFCTEETTPCPAPARYGCSGGKIVWESSRFRIHIDAIANASIPEQGIVTQSQPTKIRVAYIYPSWSGGRFERTSADAVLGCMP